MRTFLLSILSLAALSLPVATARGQALFDYRMWFDCDDVHAQSGTASERSCHIDADVSGLSASLHVLNYQVKNASGVWSAPTCSYFLRTALPDLTCRYWMDEEMTASTYSYGEGITAVDVSGLTEGLHLLHWQVGVGAPQSCAFLRTHAGEEMTSYYWFDEDSTGVRSCKYSGEVEVIDVSDLSEGLHSLHWQAGSGSTLSAPHSQLFIKIPQVIGIEYQTCLFLVDEEQYSLQRVATSDGIMHVDLPVDSLPQGLHHLKIVCITPSGVASTTAQTFFLRVATTQELGSMRCLYSIDGSEFVQEAASYQSGLYHFDLDVAAIDDGLHTLNYALVCDDGTSTRINTAFFTKSPDGGPGIVRYDYWLNDRMTETMQSTLLDERVNPLSLVTMLPVTAQPIRSSSFHFEVVDEIPIVYAQNDFHLRAHDVEGRMVEQSATYVDYTTAQVVTDLTDLQTRQTVARPEENGIRWYKFEAELHNSFTLKSSRPCTLQVFSPTGAEVYSATGAASTKSGGARITEAGTHYVALHDVTDSSQSLTLEFDLRPYTPGDANNDDTVDIADVVLTISAYLDASVEINFDAADVKTDSLLDIQDAVGIIDLYLTPEMKKAINQTNHKHNKLSL